MPCNYKKEHKKNDIHKDKSKISDVPKENSIEVENIIKNSGLKVSSNELSPTELLENGYRKMSINEVTYVEPLFKLAPQLVIDKINTATIQNAFKEATANSYKCHFDNTKYHLAKFKDCKEHYTGTLLNNDTNQICGQAHWEKNNITLSVSNIPNIALSAFNTLSVITGQYFMAQINDNLIEINSEIKVIQDYLKDKEKSELETAFQELTDIFEHLHFIQKNNNRISSTIIQLDAILKASKNLINFNIKQIDNVIKSAVSTDKESIITENLNRIRENLFQYRFAIYIYNSAHILKIYLNNITNVEELNLYREKLESIVEQYKSVFDQSITWSENYLNDTKALNKSNKKQILLSLGSGMAISFIRGQYHLSKLGIKTAAFVNDYFDEKRKIKKNQMIITHNEYKEYMSNMQMVESTLTAINDYISTAQKNAEIVMYDNEYYIKYLDNNEDKSIQKNNIQE